MGTKSQFFRAFVAGQTISDGREITPQMIDDMASTFDPATYSPRVNIEHIAGFSPEPPFNGYGDVCAVRAQDDEITVDGKTTKRRALYCQVDGNDQLVQLAGRDQKPFPSVEITANYAGTKKTGLVGLAFTDTPASIATQRLQFSRAIGTDVFTATDRADLKFEVRPAGEDGIATAIASGFAALAAKLGFTAKEPEAKADTKVPANDNAFDPAAFTAGMGETVGAAIAAALKPVTQAQADQANDFAALKQLVETTAKPGFSRQAATGGSTAAQTDC